jgi:nitrate reductase NapAB chaperone NapD
MPIKSYITIPKKGLRDQLLKKLSNFENVEVETSDNRDVLILVTDTSDKVADKELFNELKDLDEVQLISMVSAFSDSTQ